MLPDPITGSVVTYAPFAVSPPAKHCGWEFPVPTDQCIRVYLSISPALIPNTELETSWAKEFSFIVDKKDEPAMSKFENQWTFHWCPLFNIQLKGQACVQLKPNAPAVTFIVTQDVVPD